LTQPGLDRGNSTFDIRHRLTFNYVWELPFFHHQHVWLAAVLSGWQLNGIWSLQTGAHWSPFDSRIRSRRFTELVPGACDPNEQGFVSDPANCLNTGGDYNLDGKSNDRPNAAANHVNATHDQWADGFNLPDNFFSAPCLGCVGNLGRNTFIGPSYWVADTSVSRNFKIAEHLRLQFRAEVFNLLNHTNFQLGEPTGPSGKNSLNNPQFGQAGGTSNPRNLQFGLKLSF
jgi:hypothetical protein